jgi:glycogen debranching enzyme
LAGGPIALCEVQGYVFAAKTQAAKLARRMGEHDLEKKLRAEAQILREKFDAAFWCADLGTFALTLDGSKAPCRARADNAIIALGLARYGFASHAARVFAAMFEVAPSQELRRLPELFCGLTRKMHRGPTAYPVACAPQAWACAAPFALLSACLGMELRFEENSLTFHDPVFPAFLDHVIVSGLRLGHSMIDVKLQRHGDHVTVNLLRRHGENHAGEASFAAPHLACDAPFSHEIEA